MIERNRGREIDGQRGGPTPEKLLDMAVWKGWRRGRWSQYSKLTISSLDNPMYLMMTQLAERASALLCPRRRCRYSTVHDAREMGEDGLTRFGRAGPRKLPGKSVMLYVHTQQVSHAVFVCPYTMGGASNGRASLNSSAVETQIYSTTGQVTDGHAGPCLNGLLPSKPSSRPSFNSCLEQKSNTARVDKV